MKKITLLILLSIQISFLSAQTIDPKAKKPTIMVVPSDFWCNSNGYMTEFSHDETNTIKIPDYRKALQEHYELNAVISKIGELMAERGFPLVDLESTLRKLQNDAAFINMSSSKNTGAAFAENPIDILNRTAKADIIMKLDWKLNSLGGPRKSVSFNLQGIDAYTSKQVTAAGGNGKQTTSAELPVLLEEAVLAHLDKFNDGLMTHFEDISENGREGTLIVRVWDDSPVDLETEYDFKGRTAELKRIIGSYWMPRNTVNNSFSQDEASENIQRFSQVRIPLYGDDGWGGQMAMDFNTWGQQLADLLKSDLGIVTKVVPRGLGEVNLIIGGK